MVPAPSDSFRLRRKAIEAAEAWMLERFERSDGLGAIYPPIVWSIVALKCLGYADDSPEVQYNHKQLEDLILRDEETGAIRVQPCKSPVWDTAITLRALAAGGISPDSRPIRKAVSWLLKQQIRQPGDWSETVAAEPGGWCFEYANDFYPDVGRHRHGAHGPACSIPRSLAAVASLAAGFGAGR